MIIYNIKIFSINTFKEDWQKIWENSKNGPSHISQPLAFCSNSFPEPQKPDHITYMCMIHSNHKLTDMCVKYASTIVVDITLKYLYCL